MLLVLIILIKQLQNMNNFSSPFTQQINSCKSIMKKLRKKIYKHTLSHVKIGKKTKDNPEAILDILHERQIPSFVFDNLKKRRNFDLLSIKNIVINNFLTYDEIRKRTDDQQQQINQLYQSHKARIIEIKANSAPSKSQKFLNQSSEPSGCIYSSTQEEEQLQSSVKPFELQQQQMQLYQNSFQESLFEKLSSEKNEIQSYHENLSLMNHLQNQPQQDLFLFNF